MTLPATGGAPAALDPPLPRELQVEVTGAGNLRCRTCLVRYTAGRGIAVGLTSNAVLLNRARARALIEARLSWLHVAVDGAVDGATAGTYGEIRHGTGFAPRPGQFDRVLRNLRGVF